LVLGIVIFSPFIGSLGWILPLALIAGGAYLVLRRPRALSWSANTGEESPIVTSAPAAQAPVTPAAAEETVAATPVR
jgi:hypothetical protein